MRKAVVLFVEYLSSALICLILSSCATIGTVDKKNTESHTMLNGNVTIILEPVASEQEVMIDLYILNVARHRLDRIWLGPHLDNCVIRSLEDPEYVASMHAPYFRVAMRGKVANYTGPLIYSSYGSSAKGFGLDPYEKKKIGRFSIGVHYDVSSPGVYEISFAETFKSTLGALTPLSNTVFYQTIDGAIGDGPTVDAEPPTPKP